MAQRGAHGRRSCARRLEWGFGGKAQLDVIYDVNAVGFRPDSGFFREFITSDIPMAGPTTDRTGRVGFSPNQSRFYSWMGVPTPWGPFKAYMQINLSRSLVDIQIQVHRLWAQWA